MSAKPVFDGRMERLREELRRLTTQCEEISDVPSLEPRAAAFFTPEQYQLMSRVVKKGLWIAMLMVHQRRQGHAASTASAMHLMTAMYFSRAWDLLKFADGKAAGLAHSCESQKPHAVPGWDALLYLEGMFSQEQLQAFRTFQGPNAYPTHVDPGVQIPTGSLGLGPAAAAALAFVDQYNNNHGSSAARGLQISIIGDSEFDEGVIFESIKERASLGITGWIDFIDYNRQSLDGNLDERSVDRIAGVYGAHGIPVVILKYGSQLQEIFRMGAGGRELRRRIDALSTEDYQALLRQPDNITRRVMTLRRPDFESFLYEGTFHIGAFLEKIEAADSKSDPALEALFVGKSDLEVKEIFFNLGGHDLPMLISVIERIKAEGSRAAVIAYTVKGWGMEPLVGSLSGHWKKLDPDQLQDFAKRIGPDIVAGERQWERFAKGDVAAELLNSVADARSRYDTALKEESRSDRQMLQKAIAQLGAFPTELPCPESFKPDEPISTQVYLGSLLGRLSKVESNDPLSPLCDRIVTLAADVAFTAGLRDWVNRKGVWGVTLPVDIARKYGETPEMNVQPRVDGQHVRLSNLEQFLGLLAAAFGKSGDLMGAHRFPLAFFYDVFLERFAEMLKYAAYWDASAWFIGTIAGASAPGESGLHHGALSALIGRATPNVMMWEPTFPLELNWILADEFRRAIEGEDAGRRIRYIRAAATQVRQEVMLKQLIAQPRFAGHSERAILDVIRPQVLAGGYRLVDRKPVSGFSAQSLIINIFSTGVSVLEAVEASQRLFQQGVLANVIAVTSPNLLLDRKDNRHLESLIPADERAFPILSVTDSHPMYLQGIGRRLASGGRQPLEAALGATTFDRSGTEEEIKKFHQIDADSIVRTALSMLEKPWRD